MPKMVTDDKIRVLQINSGGTMILIEARIKQESFFRGATKKFKGNLRICRQPKKFTGNLRSLRATTKKIGAAR